jgi:hypothetical protein
MGSRELLEDQREIGALREADPGGIAKHLLRNGKVEKCRGKEARRPEYRFPEWSRTEFQKQIRTLQ